MGEIATLEEQRLPRHGRQGVSEAITEVQSGRMISPAEQAPRLARRLGLFRGYGRQLDSGSLNKRIQLPGSRVTATCLQDYGCLEQLTTDMRQAEDAAMAVA